MTGTCTAVLHVIILLYNVYYTMYAIDTIVFMYYTCIRWGINLALSTAANIFSVDSTVTAVEINEV